MDIFMQAAISEALEGLSEGGVPIGATLVEKGMIIGRGRNRRVQDQDQLMHAEMDFLGRGGTIILARRSFIDETRMLYEVDKTFHKF